MRRHLKPVREQEIRDFCKGRPHIFTLENHQITGGLGGLVAEILAAEKNQSAAHAARRARPMGAGRNARLHPRPARPGFRNAREQDPGRSLIAPLAQRHRRRKHMKTCLVTGGARGIGRATCLLAAKNGYQLAVGGLAESPRCTLTLSSPRSSRAAVRPSPLSAMSASEKDIVAMFAEDEVVVGPGGCGRQRGRPLPTALLRRRACSSPTSIWMMRINVTGLIICCREAIRQMDGRGGSIVNISSMAATIGGRPGAAAYAASKAAVDSYTTGAARDHRQTWHSHEHDPSRRRRVTAMTERMQQRSGRASVAWKNRFRWVASDNPRRSPRLRSG
ncbi:MAG: SDR family NAD(P)-dependent oxidoreductase [Rhodoblastus sp.]